MTGLRIADCGLEKCSVEKDSNHEQVMCFVKRWLLCLPLLGLAPAGYFLGPYLEGAGLLPNGFGLIVSGGSMFVLPWIAAFCFVALLKAKMSLRILLFIPAVVFQGLFLFTFCPPAATGQTMGLAHRLGREFPAGQMRDCAGQLRLKFVNGTLKASKSVNDNYFVGASENALVVDDSELPVSLRGRFHGVYIEQASNTGTPQVVFALTPKTGILCDSRGRVRDFWFCSIADGVHAYRYERL